MNKCPYCSQKPMPTLLKIFSNIHMYKKIQCENCNKWIKILKKWLFVYIFSAVIPVIVGVLIYFNNKSFIMFITGFVLFYLVLESLFLYLVPFKPYE